MLELLNPPVFCKLVLCLSVGFIILPNKRFKKNGNQLRGYPGEESLKK